MHPPTATFARPPPLAQTPVLLRAPVSPLRRPRARPSPPPSARVRTHPRCAAPPPPPDETPPPDPVTCGDALREWLVARDNGNAPLDVTACAAARVDVLFVGRDNETTSVAAEAIFTDLCRRRDLHCIACHSVGTRVHREGKAPHPRFVEALRFKKRLDVSRKMACRLDRADLDSYALVVCMDEHTRSEVLYMVADDEGRFEEESEEKIVVLSQYCSEPRLRAMQFRSGEYSKDAMNFLIAALVDACHGLLNDLIESPRIPQP